jgi:hypothetical protein
MCGESWHCPSLANKPHCHLIRAVHFSTTTSSRARLFIILLFILPLAYFTLYGLCFSTVYRACELQQRVIRLSHCACSQAFLDHLSSYTII